jgi:hypothetical protein
MFDILYSETKLAEIEFTHPEKFRSIPSLALPAICVLDDYLTKDMRVFEWGSGASTLFFAMRCQEQSSVTSIEHSEKWFNVVRKALKYRGMDFANRSPDYYLKKPGEGFLPDFASSQPGYDSINFKAYVECIGALDDDSQDVILVDGRARCACLEHAQPKLKPGGLLILDDSRRSIYQYAVGAIDWPVMHLEGCIPFYKHGHTVRTTIWVKP